MPTPDHRARSANVRRLVAIVLTPAPPGALDRYVEIEGSDAVLKVVLREAQAEGELRYAVRFGDRHSEVVSTHDLAANTSQGGKLLVFFKPRVFCSFTLISRSQSGNGVMCYLNSRLLPTTFDTSNYFFPTIYL
jgi:hypothetical protein